MQSCSFKHLLAGQVETNAAKTFQHIFKSQPRTNLEGFKHVFKMKPVLSLNAACSGAQRAVSRPGASAHPCPWGRGCSPWKLQWPGVSAREDQCAWDLLEQVT